MTRLPTDDGGLDLQRTGPEFHPQLGQMIHTVLVDCLTYVQEEPPAPGIDAALIAQIKKSFRDDFGGANTFLRDFVSTYLTALRMPPQWRLVAESLWLASGETNLLFYNDTDELAWADRIVMTSSPDGPLGLEDLEQMGADLGMLESNYGPRVGSIRLIKVGPPAQVFYHHALGFLHRLCPADTIN